MNEPAPHVDGRPVASGTDLPLEASLALDGDGARIAHARHLAVDFLAKIRDHAGVCVATTAVEVVQLIVSELVTNTGKYAPGPALLHLRVTGALLTVELWDSSPVVPVAKAADPSRIGQHGLEIVAALAQAVRVEQTALGKRISADIALDTAA
ncbi:ATP-binding protein [Streptomyces sp. NPDC001910]|uniref:ATP-binding protein n=1 Tax=Streptomyces sp. NPDC001910 TaxID=3154403 RepID=UPI00332E4078